MIATPVPRKPSWLICHDARSKRLGRRQSLSKMHCFQDVAPPGRSRCAGRRSLRVFGVWAAAAGTSAGRRSAWSGSERRLRAFGRIVTTDHGPAMLSRSHPCSSRSALFASSFGITVASFASCAPAPGGRVATCARSPHRDRGVAGAHRLPCRPRGRVHALPRGAGERRGRSPASASTSEQLGSPSSRARLPVHGPVRPPAEHPVHCARVSPPGERAAS